MAIIVRTHGYHIMDGWLSFFVHMAINYVHMAVL